VKDKKDHTSVSSKKKSRAGRLLNELIAWSGVDWPATKMAEKERTKAQHNAAAPARRRLDIVVVLGQALLRACCLDHCGDA